MMSLVWIMGVGLCIISVIIVAENIYRDFFNNNKKTKLQAFKEDEYYNKEIDGYKYEKNQKANEVAKEYLRKKNSIEEKCKEEQINLNINQNEILDEIIKNAEKPKYNHRKTKGETYEKYIARFWKNEGYKVYMNGLKNGNADGGIDVICHKNKETILIQCKHWKRPVDQKEIRQFIGDCYVYINKKKKYLQNRTIRKMFITSCEETKIAVELYVKENEEEIEYVSMPYI